MSSKIKDSSIELLRIIACFLVLFNHTIKVPEGLGFNNILTLLSFFICKTAVPIFVIISGWTMLDKQYSYKTAITKVLRVVEALIVFSFLSYYSLAMWDKVDELSILEIFLTIWQGKALTNFWYLYMYIGLLISMPFLQKLVKVMSKNDFHVYFIVSGIICCIFPIIVQYIPLLRYSSDLDLSFFNVYIALLFVGYYLKHFISFNKHGMIMSAITILASNLFLVLVTLFGRTNSMDYLFWSDRTFFPIIISAISLFYFVKCIPLINEKVTEKINILGSYTFGVYVASGPIHFILNILYRQLSPICTPVIAAIITDILVFIFTILFLKLLRRIPFIKKII